MKTITIPVNSSMNCLPSPHGLLFVRLLLAWFCFSSTVQAVVPPPDGGYLNATTAEGDSALFSLTSGIDNTALGFQALFNNTTGNFNTASGVNTLFHNTTASQNTATGVNALLNN